MFRILMIVGLVASVCPCSAVGKEDTRQNPLRRGETVRQMSGQPAVVHAVAETDESEEASPEIVSGEFFASEMCDESGCDVFPVSTSGCLSLWGGFETLLWWQKDTRTPALVTTSEPNTPRDAAGVLGLSTTSTLFGGEIENDTSTGGRLTIGTWLGDHSTGIGGRLFAIDGDTVSFAGTSEQFPILARPFFNAFTGEDDAVLVGFPDTIVGNVNLTLETENTGAEVFLRKLFRTGCNYRIDLVLGYRYLGVDESLMINNSLEFIDPTDNSFGNTIDQQDIFDMQNDFHGGEIGFMGHSVDGCWTLDFLATVAFGETRQLAHMQGSTVQTPLSGPSNTSVGGLLAQRSNIGMFEDNPFTVVPEVTITLGYMVTSCLDVSIGYTFLHSNHVLRPGRVVDTSVNLTQLTTDLEGEARPAFEFKDSDYWLQGINFGVNWRF